MLQSSSALSAEIDADRMAQVLSNLLSNALAYGAAGTPVSVLLRREQDHAVLEVHNSGAAIPQERIAALFEPMRRLRQETPRSGNIGLGLFIVDSIVRAHGGNVEVRSGDGSTRFIVSLPLRQRR